MEDEEKTSGIECDLSEVEKTLEEIADKEAKFSAAVYFNATAEISNNYEATRKMKLTWLGFA